MAPPRLRVATRMCVGLLDVADLIVLVIEIVRDCGSDEGAAVRRFAVCLLFRVPGHDSRSDLTA
eukprot:7335746-Prymnesium_polylepis.1